MKNQNVFTQQILQFYWFYSYEIITQGLHVGQNTKKRFSKQFYGLKIQSNK